MGYPGVVVVVEEPLGGHGRVADGSDRDVGEVELPGIVINTEVFERWRLRENGLEELEVARARLIIGSGTEQHVAVEAVAGGFRGVLDEEIVA